MALALVDHNQVAKLAESVRRFEFRFDDYTEPLLYPSKDTDPVASSNFFFFMVAIDHRTHPRGRLFRGKVDGVELTGAELLWALAKRRFILDQQFFSPAHLSKVTINEIRELFRSHGLVVSGPRDRARLLRDCAQKLERYYDGSVLNLIRASQDYLLRRGGRGLLQLLKPFEAYSDPLNKKSFLLVKFLVRRGYLRPKDPENLHVPIDNVVQRLALRTGILQLIDHKLERKIKVGAPIPPVEETALRQLTSRAFDRVGEALGMPATYLDDILWEFGRVHCRVPIPTCDALPPRYQRRPYRMIVSGPIGECPFGAGCKGYNMPEIWELKEPNIKTIFY